MRGDDQWERVACGSKHTARMGTPLYRLKTGSERVKLAPHLAMVGLSIAAIVCVQGVEKEYLNAVE